MESIKIAKINKELIVQFSNKNVALPLEWQKRVDEYWQSLINSGRKYTRGDVFTVTEIQKEGNILRILVEKTDYAHYLFCQNIDQEMGGYGINVIFTACLVETTDNRMIFGKMGKHTARAGIYQLAGGGIDASDIEYGIFNLKNNIAKELREEVNIDANDHDRVKYFNVKYIKQGGKTKKIAVVFQIQLNETAEEFLKKYNNFIEDLRQKNEMPEFEEIIALEKSDKEIENFFTKHRKECDEYMEPLFKYVYR